MRIHLALPPSGLRDNEHQMLGLMKHDLLSGRAGPYSHCESAADADLIVFVESVDVKDRKDVPGLLADSRLQNHPTRCVTINREDQPPGFLPGLYASLPTYRFDERRHRAWGYLFSDPFFFPYYERRDSVVPSLLFSFRGSLSHPVRKQMLRRIRTSAPHAMTRTYGWYNHSVDDKRAYIEEMLDSAFVLCPRGIGTCSNRLMEVMAMGRCPVIISDDWVPPGSIAWEEFSLRVREEDVASIPELLEAERDNAADRGALARETWEQYFAPEVCTRTAMDQLREQTRANPITASADDYAEL